MNDNMQRKNRHLFQRKEKSEADMQQIADPSKWTKPQHEEIKSKDDGCSSKWKT